jgi:class 3 adenylate cyclase
VRQFDGAVVKRIGDEVLATFESVLRCEQFLDALQKDEVLRNYNFKAAADYGEVFFLKFLEHLEDDLLSWTTWTSIYQPISDMN